MEHTHTLNCLCEVLKSLPIHEYRAHLFKNMIIHSWTETHFITAELWKVRYSTIVEAAHSKWGSFLLLLRALITLYNFSLALPKDTVLMIASMKNALWRNCEWTPCNYAFLCPSFHAPYIPKPQSEVGRTCPPRCFKKEGLPTSRV